MSTLNWTMSIAGQKALESFMATITPINAFAQNFSAETAAKGSAIKVPLVGAITATTFNASYTGTGGTINTVTVTLNRHRIATVDLTDVQQLNTDVMVDKFAAQLGSGLAKLVLQDIWGIVLTTNYANATVTTASANWSKSSVRTMRLALAKANVDTSRTSLVINEDCFDALLGDTNIAYAMYYGGAEGIREGKIPRLLGCDVYPTNLMPTNSITLYGFLCHPDAIAVAFRGFQSVVPDGAYESFGPLVDPSGISLNERLLYEPETGKRFWSLECLFGFAAGVTPGLTIATGANA